MYGWNTDVPAWDIMFTEDGANYTSVGVITVFADGVKGSLNDGTKTLENVSGTAHRIVCKLVNKADHFGVSEVAFDKTFRKYG